MSTLSPSPVFGIGIDSGFANTGIAAVALLDASYVSLGGRVITTEAEAGKQLRVSSDDARRTVCFFDAILDVVDRISQQGRATTVIGLEDYHVYDTADTAGLINAARDVVTVASKSPWTTGGGAGGSAGGGGGLADFDRKLQALRKHAWAGSASVGLRGRGKAAKTLLVNGVAIAVARLRRLPLFVFMPADRAKRFGGGLPRGTPKKAQKAAVAAGVRRIVQNVDSEIAARVPQTTLQEHAFDATALAVLALEEYLKYHAGVAVGAAAGGGVVVGSSGEADLDAQGALHFER